MVTKTVDTQLNRLESQVENGGGGAWEYLCLVRKLNVRRSDKVLKHGLSILNDPKKRSIPGPDGGLENFQTAKKYYSSTIDLTGGKNTGDLFGICLCTSAIGQLTKWRNKEDKDSPDLHLLATAVLEKDYKQRTPGKLPVLASALKGLKI